jgi:hypothetical protein
MKRSVFLAALLAACAHQAPKPEFIPHAEDVPMHSYVAMNLDYAPYKAVLGQIENVEHISLKNRGEAHVTVISPVEFDRVLKPRLSIQQIQSLALEMKLQDSPLNPVCVGVGQKELNGKLEKTYFVVLESAALLNIRTAVQKAFVQAGGRPQDFLPGVFFPHVTLGYTARDLHFEDGVLKDKSSCRYSLTELNIQK